MSEKTIAQKLLIKAGRTVLLVNAPRGYQMLLGKLPVGVKLLKTTKPADVVQVFVASRQELEAQLPKLKPLVNAGGLLWVTYPKGTSKKFKADIHRDTIHACGKTLGLEGVALIAIDDDWSAMRFKVV